MKRILIMIIIISAGVFAQDMRPNAFSSLFSDYKANHIGDAITIYVVESSSASNEAETSTGKTSDLGLSASANVGSGGMPKVDASIGSKNNFQGSGSTKSSGRVTTKISAMIDSVYDNGNLRVRGSRKIVINGEEQIISIKGIVRPIDIQTDNSVLSYNISEAEIIFEGNGMIQKAQGPGLLTKLFHWLF
ncbi:MAG: flagellar basal body L-ring protein FlgH [Ignavibacteriales bacterium]|nr:flagellar basal body L-ring protein FlgH [Ignavibacteriales bacterium]